MRESCPGLHPPPPFFYFLSPLPALSNPSESGSQNNFNTYSQVSHARASFCYFRLTTSYPETCLWACPFFFESNQPSGAFPSLDTDPFLYSVIAVCSDGWACRKQLGFSLENHSHQRRLSLLRRVSQTSQPWPLLRLNAPCVEFCPRLQFPKVFSGHPASGQGHADVVLPWILGAALLLQTVQTLVCIVWLLWLWFKPLGR